MSANARVFNDRIEFFNPGAAPEFEQGQDFTKATFRFKRKEGAGKRVTPQVTPQVKRLLQVCNGELFREELQKRIGLADRKHFREDYLRPALDAKLIEMTLPKKPNSRNQKYRLSAQGEILRKTREEGK